MTSLSLSLTDIHLRLVNPCMLLMIIFCIKLAALDTRCVFFFFCGYFYCVTHPKDIDASDKMCIDLCFPGSTDPGTLSVATCLLDYYEEHIKRH